MVRFLPDQQVREKLFFTKSIFPAAIRSKRCSSYTFYRRNIAILLGNYDMFLTVWLGLGANVSGNFTTPVESLAWALQELAAHGMHVEEVSAVYRSRAMGVVRQPDYYNAVARISHAPPPARLLHLVKTLERRAGRTLGVHWGPRPLDIDILAHGSRIIGHPQRATRRGTLIVPHPGLADREFVLVPLAELAPHWRHPLLRLTAGELLRRRPGVRRRARSMVRLPR
ncbi:MAG: 2-amino-4-hydroxy-6-hydroxymethyldihydropteridine diphosphokinase [Hyphomicrobiaceae bacterium]